MRKSRPIRREECHFSRMSPAMTDFHLTASSADDAALRGFLRRGFFDILSGRFLSFFHMARSLYQNHPSCRTCRDLILRSLTVSSARIASHRTGEAGLYCPLRRASALSLRLA